MKYQSILILVILLCLAVTTNGYINPTVDAQRRAILPQFLMKIIGDPVPGLNNITTLAGSDYCWHISYSGSFCGVAAQDYVGILFIQIPYYNQTTNELVLLRIAYIQLLILEIDLVNDGLTNDTYVIKYINNATQLDTTTYQYNTQTGQFYQAYYTFQKNSTLVSSEVVISTEGGKFVDSFASVTDSVQLCVLITGLPDVFAGACPTGSIYQQYSSFEDCLYKMAIIDAQHNAKGDKKCPDASASNTTACRILHATVALTNPTQSQSMHCPHTGTPSPVCIDHCDSVCSTCALNAKCTYNVNIYGVRSYSCVCKEGYSGDGPSSCQSTNCTANWQCGSGNYYNYAACNTSTNLCYCKPTFTWNPSTSRCECQNNATVQYIDGQAVCLQLGRCTERYHCTTAGYNSDAVMQQPIGDWSDLTCVAYGALTPIIPYKTCVCNYGFTGGFYIPCTCPSGKTKVWSSTISGNMCLASDECTANWQCSSQTCNFSSGPTAGVGICASSKKNGRSHY